MMYKKLCRGVLTLGASFVATNSVSYSMIANHGLYAQNEFQNQCRVERNFAGSDCGDRFMQALGSFRNIMARTSVFGEVNLADFPSVISAQNKLIDAMSDVISFLLQRQKQQFDRSDEISDMFTKLGNMFSDQKDSSSLAENQSIQSILSNLTKAEEGAMELVQKHLKKDLKNCSLFDLLIAAKNAKEDKDASDKDKYVAELLEKRCEEERNKSNSNKK